LCTLTLEARELTFIRLSLGPGKSGGLANAKRFLEKYSLIAIVEEVVKRCAHSLWEKLRT
jgi:hypothetical protein